MNRHPYLRLVAKNVFTLFNLVNVILAVMVAWVGEYRNMLFIGVAVANTLISTVNGVRAQRTIDRLRLLAEQEPKVVREGSVASVPVTGVVVGDTLVLTLGDQVPFDSVVLEGVLEVNEAFVTGEQEAIAKKAGDKLISGSFVVAGEARARVTAVGADNSLTRLETEAHEIRGADSKLFTILNKIVRYISYALIPIGALLLWARFGAEDDAATAVTSTVAALISMIPEGLILLTSSVLALATIRLARQKVLVQDLYSVETLARVDTICLDKTGTLTTGRMEVVDILTGSGEVVDLRKGVTGDLMDGAPAEKRVLRPLTAILSHQMGETATITALKAKLKLGASRREIEGVPEVTEVVAFSSERKYSGVKVAGGAEFCLGAVEFLTSDRAMRKQVKELGGGLRTLAVVERRFEREKLLGVVRLRDETRRDAKEIIRYFYENEIEVKVISGDDLAAVTEIAAAVGVKDLRGVELSEVKKPDFDKLVREYGIFTRVTPRQKKELVKALRRQGRVVAMTGDGVNDILAMKEADVSMAIGAGADAARRAARIVLLDSDFAGVPKIVDEGRQSINNLERSATLFLTKTVYAAILTVLFVILPIAYPFSPIEMSLLNFVCIGWPGLILALEHNTTRIQDQFVANIRRYAVPTGVVVMMGAVALAIFGEVFSWSHAALITASAWVVWATGVFLVGRISWPLSRFRAGVILSMVGIFAGAMLIPFVREIFEFVWLDFKGTMVVIWVIGVEILVILGWGFLVERRKKKTA